METNKKSLVAIARESLLTKEGITASYNALNGIRMVAGIPATNVDMQVVAMPIILPKPIAAKFAELMHGKAEGVGNQARMMLDGAILDTIETIIAQYPEFFSSQDSGTSLSDLKEQKEKLATDLARVNIAFSMAMIGKKEEEQIKLGEEMRAILEKQLKIEEKIAEATLKAKEKKDKLTARKTEARNFATALLLTQTIGDVEITVSSEEVQTQEEVTNDDTLLEDDTENDDPENTTPADDTVGSEFN